ncbi:MAG: hypothetical protein IID37_07135 [Planctomycetes bacterium]|nr:hypothetical protein [Planctomycetota bacterium]
MITRIGVIVQDASSSGFLRGLGNRLGCAAEFVDAPAAMGKSRSMTSKQARQVSDYFRRRGVHLIVRFTDADGVRWQDVRRSELEVFPSDIRSMLVCGVAVENVEDLLCRDAPYLAHQIDIPLAELNDPLHRTERIKKAIHRLTARSGKKRSDVVAKLVEDVPAEIFRRWLTDNALRKLYTDCRAAASRADCETPNELEPSS